MENLRFLLHCGFTCDCAPGMTLVQKWLDFYTCIKNMRDACSAHVSFIARAQIQDCPHKEQPLSLPPKKPRFQGCTEFECDITLTCLCNVMQTQTIARVQDCTEFEYDFTCICIE